MLNKYYTSFVCATTEQGQYIQYRIYMSPQDAVDDCPIWQAAVVLPLMGFRTHQWKPEDAIYSVQLGVTLFWQGPFTSPVIVKDETLDLRNIIAKL